MAANIGNKHAADNHFNYMYMYLPLLLPLPDLNEAMPKSVPNEKLDVHV